MTGGHGGIIGMPIGDYGEVCLVYHPMVNRHMAESMGMGMERSMGTERQSAIMEKGNFPNGGNGTLRQEVPKQGTLN